MKNELILSQKGHFRASCQSYEGKKERLQKGNQQQEQQCDKRNVEDVLD